MNRWGDTYTLVIPELGGRGREVQGHPQLHWVKAILGYERPWLNSNTCDSHTCEPGSFTIQHTEEYCFQTTWPGDSHCCPAWDSIPTTCASLKPSKLWRAAYTASLSLLHQKDNRQLQSVIWSPITRTRCMPLLPPPSPPLEYSQARWICLENTKRNRTQRQALWTTLVMVVVYKWVQIVLIFLQSHPRILSCYLNYAGTGNRLPNFSQTQASTEDKEWSAFSRMRHMHQIFKTEKTGYLKIYF